MLSTLCLSGRASERKREVGCRTGVATHHTRPSQHEAVRHALKAALLWADLQPADSSVVDATGTARLAGVARTQTSFLEPLGEFLVRWPKRLPRLSASV